MLGIFGARWFRGVRFAGLVTLLVVIALGVSIGVADARVECHCDGSIMVCNIYSVEGYFTAWFI